MENKTQPFVSGGSRGIDSFRRSMRRGVRRGQGGGALWQVIKGVLLGASLTVVAIAAFALILSWWDASDRAIGAINQVVKFAAILLGVSAAVSSGGAGTMRGMAVGVLYMALGILCYSLLMGQSPRLSAYMADLGMGLAAGGLFGMILTGRKG